MSMDTDQKIMTAFLGIIGLFLFMLATILIVSTCIEAKNKDRELTIREREIELKAEQYPYKNEMKLEVTHD